jgi:AcrR family transcriptional regulator
MRIQRAEIVNARREQIVEAAVAVIAEQGLHHLSLSEIETRAGMSRGQLTYYFPTKEEILLAVFDRLLAMIYQRVRGGNREACAAAPPGADFPERLRSLLTMIVHQPPVSPEFNSLQYTFLSQLGYREDFRQRLAKLYEEWRSRMAEDLVANLARRPANRRVSPRALSSLVQAILHGLAMQLTADPGAFDRAEMVNLCVDVLNTYLKDVARPRRKKAAVAAAKRNGHMRERRPPGTGLKGGPL